MKINDSKIKVTIMIPTFNQAEFIRDAIESALSQTYSNLEVIVGDDASTDNTPQIVATINDSRLKYVRNSRNLGRVGNYRMLLYTQATGDYVVNLDGDDYYSDPDFISEAVKLIVGGGDVVIVAARARWKVLNQELISQIPDVKEVSGIDILKNLPSKRYLLKHMACLYKREYALSMDFYSSKSNSSDWSSLYQLSLLGRVRYLDRIVGVWRIHDQNESTTTNHEKLMANLSIWAPIYKKGEETGLDPILAKFLWANCVAYFASSFVTNISLTGNLKVIRFLMDVFKNYKFPALLLMLTPTYLARVLFALIGYYRFKASILCVE